MSISRGGTSAKNFTTTNLIAHLRSQHAVRYREFGEEQASQLSKQSVTCSSGLSTASSTSTNGACFQPTLQKCASMKVWPIDHPRAQAITMVIGKMMALDYQPFSVVQDEGFKRLMKLVAPK